MVLKPRHSAFFGTPLEPLLTYFDAGRLIITGVATESCVLYTAADAYMRDYELVVPFDCVAPANEGAGDYALQHMHTLLKANLRRPSELSLL